MAGFLNLSDAAQSLGIDEEQLKELCTSGEIRGFRDGPSWKFKQDELDRYKEQKASGGVSDMFGDDDLGELDLDADDDDPDASSSILVSEESLGKSDATTSSTVIGAATGGSAIDSDLKMAEDGGGSDIRVTADDPLVHDLSEDSDEVKVIPGGSDVLSGSDSEAELKLATGSGTGDLLDDTGDTGDDELAIGSDALDLGDDMELALADDDDLVLGGTSGSGSDVSLAAADSGINLAAPSDSGLSLEEDEPLELSGSSLELPEDDDFIALDDAADPDEATQLKQDEEFLLSPSDELAALDEDSDSGSQVIALEDSEAFDQEAATMVATGLEGQVHDLGAPVAPVAPAEQMVVSPAPAPGPQVAMAPAEPPEAPYTIFQVLGLMACILPLGMTGILMTDLMLNMWTWQGESSASTTIMDSVIAMFGL